MANLVQQQPHSDHVAISIEEMLQKLPPIAEKPSIYRIPKRLLNTHGTAYMPQLISIGPFHHGQRDLMATEQLKLHFLNSYLSRINKKVEVVLEEARKLENKARNCYAEPIDMDEDEFVKMMLVDGCFIVELMITVDNPQSGLEPLLYEPISMDLCHDLIMLENQLPFFVLQTLFDLYHPPTTQECVFYFKQLARKFFVKGSIDPCKRCQGVPMQTVNHFVDFLRFYYTPPTVLATTGIQLNLPSTSASGNSVGRGENQQNLTPTSDSRNSTGSENQLNLPPTATELRIANVVLKKATEDSHIMDISFKKSVMKIPSFEINDVFELCLQNLMAFEHFFIAHKQKYVTHYVAFLHALISTEKDVSLLVKAKIIINNFGGNDEKLAKLFNHLGKDVAIASDRYYFDGICKDLLQHYRRPLYLWTTRLIREYFPTPYSFFSAYCSVIVIVLTVLQTISSVRQL